MPCRVILLLLLGVSLAVSGFAQTAFVLNGSFEELSACPRSYRDSITPLAAVGWIRPNKGTSSIFSSCAEIATGLGVPINVAGIQTPKNGSAYAGICLYTHPGIQPIPGGQNSRQYLQTKLLQPLKQGRRYYVEWFVSRADTAAFTYAVKNIGACFTQLPLSKADTLQFNVTPQVSSSAMITDKNSWTRIAGSFVASGGEAYLTIGRFGPEQLGETINTSGSTSLGAYYYIDQVSVMDSCTQFDVSTANVLGPDSAFCRYASPARTISAFNPLTTSYLWNTGSTASFIFVNDTGSYWVRMSNGSCTSYDTVKFTSGQKPDVRLGNDTAICFNTPVVLKPVQKQPQYRFKWYILAGSSKFEVATTSSFTVNSPDKFLLEVTDQTCSSSDTISVFRSVMSRVTLPADTFLCRQQQLTLNALTAGATQYRWSTGQNQSVIQTQNDSVYWVRVSDAFCRSTDTMRIQIRGAQPTPKDTSICETDNLILSADPTASFHEWSNGVIANFTPILNPGIYWVKQIKSGCTTSDTIRVLFDTLPKINFGSDIEACVSPYYDLQTSIPAAKTYLWSTGDVTSNLLIERTGFYWLKTTNGKCTNMDTVYAKIQINSPFSFGPDREDCFNDRILLSSKVTLVDDLTWSNGSKDTAIEVTQPGIYWLEVKYGICTNIDSIIFTAKQKPVVSLGNDTTICKGDSVIINAFTPGCTYTWNTGSNAPSITTKSAGFFGVVVENQLGCKNRDSLIVSFHKTYPFFNRKKRIICGDQTIELKPDVPLRNEFWSTGVNAPMIVVGEPKTYTLTATDSLGCVRSDTIQTEQANNPSISVYTEYRTCSFPLLIQIPDAYETYLWNDSIGSSEYEANTFGKVRLTVTDANECRSDVELTINNDCPAEILIANTFTPDGNGKNDLLIPQLTNIASMDWRIFNRWGNPVFQSNDPEATWNGKTFNGQDVEAGTYFYTIKATGKQGEQINQNGSITLFR